MKYYIKYILILCFVFPIFVNNAIADFIVLKNGSIIEGNIYRKTYKYYYLGIGDNLGTVRIKITEIDFDKTGCINYIESKYKPRPVPRNKPATSAIPSQETGDENPGNTEIPTDQSDSEKTSEPIPTPAKTDSDKKASKEVSEKIQTVLDGVAEGEWNEDMAANEISQVAKNSIGSVFLLLFQETDPLKFSTLDKSITLFQVEETIAWVSAALANKWADPKIVFTTLSRLSASSSFFELIALHLTAPDYKISSIAIQSCTTILINYPDIIQNINQMISDKADNTFSLKMFKVISQAKVAGADRFLAGYIAEDKDPVLCLAALESITALFSYSDNVKDDIVNVLDADDAKIRSMAAYALRSCHDLGVVPDLIELLDDPIPDVIANAHTSLQKLTGQIIGPKSELWEQWWDKHGANASEDVDDLIDQFYSDDTNESIKGLQALIKYNKYMTEEFTQEVREWLEDGNNRMKYVACLFLKNKNDFKAVPYIIELLNESDVNLQKLAAETLQHLTAKDFPMEYDIWMEWWEDFDVSADMSKQPTESIEEYNDEHEIETEEDEE
ncbi:HEAT repeat domain-containing protein [Planctomycetota bacterium]